MFIKKIADNQILFVYLQLGIERNTNTIKKYQL